MRPNGRPVLAVSELAPNLLMLARVPGRCWPARTAGPGVSRAVACCPRTGPPTASPAVPVVASGSGST